MNEYLEENTGVMINKAPDGRLFVSTWKLPIDTGSTMYGWAIDFFRCLEEFGKFRLLLLRLMLGRYGYREMVGMFDTLKKVGWWTPGAGYELHSMDYHRDKTKLEFNDTT